MTVEIFGSSSLCLKICPRGKRAVTFKGTSYLEDTLIELHATKTRVKDDLESSAVSAIKISLSDS